MPLTALDVENRTAGDHVYCIGKIAVFVIKVFNKMPADAKACFTSILSIFKDSTLVKVMVNVIVEVKVTPSAFHAFSALLEYFYLELYF